MYFQKEVVNVGDEVNRSRCDEGASVDFFLARRAGQQLAVAANIWQGDMMKPMKVKLCSKKEPDILCRVYQLLGNIEKKVRIYIIL